MSEETEQELTEAPSEGVPLPEFDGEETAAPESTDMAETRDGAIATTDGEQKTARDLEAVFDVPVTLSAVLGKTQMGVNTLLNLSRGAVIELDRKVGEAIDIYVNNCLVARGEIVMVEERLGVTMTEIIQSE